MINKSLIIFNILIFTIFFNGILRAKTFEFCMTEWPPYSIKTKQYGGYAGAILNEALSTNDHTLKYKFYPWKRSIFLAKLGEKCIAQVPAIKCDENLMSSKKLFDAYIGIAANKDKIKNIYKNNRLMNNLKIGVVGGQTIPKNINKLINNSNSKTTSSKDDITNIKKLFLNRADVILIDENILFYYKATQQKIAGNIEIISETLDSAPVYACFSKKAKKNLTLTNEFIDSIDIDFITFDLF